MRRVRDPAGRVAHVRQVVRGACFVLVMGGAVVREAAAHPLDLGYLRVRQAGAAVAVTLDIDSGAVALLLGTPTVDAAAVRAGATALAAATYARAPITTAAGPCTWGAATAELAGKTVTVASTATCPGEGERRWTFPFVVEQRISAKFELLVKEAVGDSERLTLIDPSKTELVLAAAAAPVPKKSSRAVVWGVISVLGVCAFCAILLRWRRRRTTSTT